MERTCKLNTVSGPSLGINFSFSTMLYQNDIEQNDIVGYLLYCEIKQINGCMGMKIREGQEEIINRHGKTCCGNDIFIALIVVMVLQVYIYSTYVKIYQIVQFKYVQFTVFQLYTDKIVKR